MSAPNTLAEAAEILTTEAQVLRVCSTFEGDWGDELDAKADYERMLRVARELRALESMTRAVMKSWMPRMTK